MEERCEKCITVPFAVLELEGKRHQKLINWLLAIILVLIVLFVGSNIAWLAYESQFETVENTETVNQTVHAEQEGDGGNAVIGGDYHG